MKILIVYLEEDEKLKRCLKSLEKCPFEIVKLKADPKKTKICEEVIQEYLNSDEFTEDVMIWHPDMVAVNGWEFMLNHYYDRFDVIGMKVFYPNGILNHYGGAINSNGVGYHPHQFALNFGLNEPLTCAYVTGPGMVIKKKVWNKVKSFDFDFQHYIDVDFCFQARKNGFTVGVVPVPVIHWEGEDGFKKRDPEVQKEMLKASHEKFVRKWFQPYDDKEKEKNKSKKTAKEIAK